MQKSIKILYTIETLRPDGAQRRLLNDLRFLDKTKFEPVVCAIFADNYPAVDFDSLQITSYCLNAKGIWGMLKALVRLYAISRKHRIEIIHSQLFFADILSRAVKLFNPRLKLISTIQAPCYEPDCKYLYSKKRLFIDSISGRMFNDAFIAVSSFVAEAAKLRLKFPAGKIRVIYNYVDVKNFQIPSESKRLETRKNLGLEPGQVALICVGRLVAVKGQNFLIEALSLLKAKGYDIIAFFVGGGDFRQELGQLAMRLKIDKNVVFTGPRKDIASLVYSSDIFVSPTLNEGFSLALLEAMVLERPCIASDIGPNQEAIRNGENGLLFEAGEAQALANAIQSLMDDRNYAAQIGSNARKTVLEKFSTDGMILQLEALYGDVLKKDEK